MRFPVRKGVVDQDTGDGKADNDAYGPENLSPQGLSLADVDKAMQGGGLQELPQRARKAYNSFPCCPKFAFERGNLCYSRQLLILKFFNRIHDYISPTAFVDDCKRRRGAEPASIECETLVAHVCCPCYEATKFPSLVRSRAQRSNAVNMEVAVSHWLVCFPMPQ